MPTVKDILRQPINVPRSVEATLPTGVPKVSEAMESVTANLPAGPEVPSMPSAGGMGFGMPTGAGMPQPPNVKNFVQSVEASLPEQAPKVSEAMPEIPGMGTPTGGGISEIVEEKPLGGTRQTGGETPTAFKGETAI